MGHGTLKPAIGTESIVVRDGWLRIQGSKKLVTAAAAEVVITCPTSKDGGLRFIRDFMGDYLQDENELEAFVNEPITHGMTVTYKPFTVKFGVN